MVEAAAVLRFAVAAAPHVSAGTGAFACSRPSHTWDVPAIGSPPQSRHSLSLLFVALLSKLRKLAFILPM